MVLPCVVGVSIISKAMARWKDVMSVQMSSKRINIKWCSFCKTKLHLPSETHNAQPLADGVCCDNCNRIVIHKRLMLMSETQPKENN